MQLYVCTILYLHDVCKVNFTFTFCASKQFIYLSCILKHDTLTFRNLVNIVPNYKVSRLRIEKKKEFNSKSFLRGLGVSRSFVVFGLPRTTNGRTDNAAEFERK